MRFSTHSYTTDWINVEIGITMGDITNPVRHGYGSHLESSRSKRRPGKHRWWLLHAPYGNIYGWYHHNLLKWRQNSLDRLDVLMAWCRMTFKSKKSRSLSVRKNKIDETTMFTGASQQIPTVSLEPVRNGRTCYRRPIDVAFRINSYCGACSSC